MKSVVQRLLGGRVGFFSVIFLIAASLHGTSSAASGFPDRPINLVVPYGPGSVDLIARRVSANLEQALNTHVIVQDKPGGSTAIAATYVARAKADGYTLFFATPAISINPVLQPQLEPHDPTRAFDPIVRIAVTPFVIVAGPSAPFNTVQGLVAYAKAHPRKLTVAITGSATVMQMAVELFAERAGIQVTQVLYGGDSGFTDLLGGRVDLAFVQTPDVPTVSHHAGVKLLAITSDHRVNFLPDVRPVGDFYPGYNVTSWNGIFAPAGTPKPVLDKLNAAFNQALAEPKLKSEFAKFGVTFVGGTRQDLGQHLSGEIAQWTKVKNSTGVSAN